MALTMWWGAYVGRSFGDRNECWSLVREVYWDRLGILLPEYGEVSAEYVAAVATVRSGDRAQFAEAHQRLAVAFEAGQAEECWRHDIVQHQPFDIVRMKGRSGTKNRVTHVGVVVDRHRMLHIEKATGSVVVPIGHVSVAGRIVGFSRHVQCKES